MAAAPLNATSLKVIGDDVANHIVAAFDQHSLPLY